MKIIFSKPVGYGRTHWACNLTMESDATYTIRLGSSFINHRTPFGRIGRYHSHDNRLVN